MRYTTGIRGVRVGGETEGGSVCGWWSSVLSVEILGCPGLTVPSVCRRYAWYFTLDLRILSVPGGKTKNNGICVFASRMVLQSFLESYGTCVAVSAPLVMPLQDLDIPANVPFTSCMAP